MGLRKTQSKAMSALSLATTTTTTTKTVLAPRPWTELTTTGCWVPGQFQARQRSVHNLNPPVANWTDHSVSKRVYIFGAGQGAVETRNKKKSVKRPASHANRHLRVLARTMAKLCIEDHLQSDSGMLWRCQNPNCAVKHPGKPKKKSGIAIPKAK
ncbi:hypothetical protein BD289DRAFT_253043 [Coniella lustricola]|uniref:Uncharacterized protein n=1 Tax=Coniella lustricola TaxID=2025994 RepID=A0A2T3A8D8_9PEZI|nr:hypothetical protein BD289DRAFT_253043 [Coniella lustricola]